MTPRDWVADRLTRLAARRLRSRHPEWADAVLSENESLRDQPEQLDWAWGTLRASVAVEHQDLLYPAMLGLSVATMIVYQWCADESLATVLLLLALSLCLGLLRPRYFLLSGLAVGAVVAAVNGFEGVSGIRPAYEVHPRTLMNCVHWLVLVLPAMAGSAAGRVLALRLPP